MTANLPAMTRPHAMRELKRLHREAAEIDRQIMEVQGRQDKAQKMISSLDAYESWCHDITTNYRLEPNDCSRIHKIREAANAGLFYDGEEGQFAQPHQVTDQIERSQVFVVKHDWAAAFEGAVGLQDEFKLPYELCAFEFRVTGHTIVLLAKPSAYGVDFLVIYEGMHGVWMTFREQATQDLANYLIKQVRAICIALEAEVADTSIVAAASKLNRKRLDSGKPLIRDFHVVDLSKKSRRSARLESSPTGRRVRMHFRRGHWRHYEKSSTWINWMLVGNPDLGFIEKHYKI